MRDVRDGRDGRGCRMKGALSAKAGAQGRAPLPRYAEITAKGGRGGGAGSSMLRVTLREVWIEEDTVQSSLSPSGEIFRVAAVLELKPLRPRPPSTKH